MKPTHLDLFSGIGGFTVAAQAAGFETIGFSEIEPYACKILKKHWPGIHNFGSVRTIPTVQCDLITGGFPCQPHSLAGKRKGSGDHRHLWTPMCDVIGRCRPAWVLGENVAGILGVELDKVLSDLESLGYRVQPLVIPACAVDAPHRRDRVWIVAHAAHVGLARLGRKGQERIAERGEAMADASEPGLEERHDEKRLRQCAATEQSGEAVSDTSGTEPERRRNGIGRRCMGTGENDGTGTQRTMRWPTEPELGRVAHGIPNRSHRLKGLGNSIVPQCAQVILEAIRAALTG
jgi:DNA (cytosine-5)-methyltransferase 1